MDRIFLQPIKGGDFSTWIGEMGYLGHINCSNEYVSFKIQEIFSAHNIPYHTFRNGLSIKPEVKLDAYFVKNPRTGKSVALCLEYYN